MTWDRVLVATDLSEESTRAADACSGLPGRPHIVLVLVADGGDRAGALEAEAARLLERGVDATARVVERDGRTVANALVEAAREEGANLLVVGARGRGRAVDRLLGSVSEAVLRGGRSVDLEANKLAIVVPAGDFRAGMLVDTEKVALGIILSVAVPKFRAALEKAIAS